MPWSLLSGRGGTTDEAVDCAEWCGRIGRNRRWDGAARATWAGAKSWEMLLSSRRRADAVANAVATEEANEQEARALAALLPPLVPLAPL